MKIVTTMSVAVLGVVAMAGSAFAAQGVSDKEIVLGSHTAMSGPVAPWGVGSVNGMNMRFEEVNAAGGVHGRKIKLIVEDHQYQVPRAVQAVNKLINRDKIFGMIAALGTPMNNAVWQQLFDKNVPSLFPYTAARSMVEPHHKLKFLYFSTYYDQTRVALKYFIEQRGKKAICMMYQDSDFGQETVDAVTDQLKVHNLTLAGKTAHTANDTDFAGAITTLRKANCDLVVLGTIIKDTLLPLGTARKMGWNVDFVGNIASYDTIVSGAKGGFTAGYYAATSFNVVYEDTAQGAAKAWIQKYKAKFKEDPSPAAEAGYLTADIVVMAFDRAGKNLTTEGFLKALESIDGYQDMFGGPTASLSPKKHKALQDSVIAQVKNGRWVPITGPLGY